MRVYLLPKLIDMKHLYLVRHAKSSWKNPSLDDIQRPLNKRGLRNAPDMASRLKQKATTIDLIISSPAKRAITTATYLALSIDYEIEKIQQQRQLYFGGSSSMLKTINNTSSVVQSLMLVGHNPDMTSLLNKLCGYQTDNMPTCAIAKISFPKEWSEIDFNDGIIEHYDFPKNNNN